MADEETTPGTGTPGPAPQTPPAVASLGSGELEAEILALTRRLAAGTYELLVLIGELDVRGSWALTGALSCAAWLATVCDTDACTAHNQLRVARAMRAFPQLAVAMASGSISYAKARVLAAHLDDTNAAALIAIAQRTPAGRLGAAIAAWSQHHEDPEQIRARQHQARSCSWRCDPDGMITLTALMTPHVAAAVCAVIDTHVMHTNPTPDAPAAAGAPAGAATAPETGAPAPAGAIPSRPTLAQQRHDALAHAIAHGGEITTEVLVHVTADGNHLTDGTPLSDHAITNLLPDAYIALLLHDTRGHPIDASPRRRSPTRRQRRVLDARQRECAHPGCTCRTFLHYDHITRYTDGGTTTLDNLQRLCGPHNRAKEPHRR
jgi:hypothetical protein